MQSAKTANRFDAIQVLRAVAALLVVIDHAITSSALWPGVTPSWIARAGYFKDFGTCGVDVFFVVSGFVMAHSLRHGSADSAIRFVAHRFLRVVPYYWLITLTFVGAMTLCGQDFTLQQYLMSLTVLPLFDPQTFHPPILLVGWTLAYELAFYCIVAAGVALAASPERRLPLVFKLVLLLATVGYVARPEAGLLTVWFNPIWFEFALGIGVYTVWQARPACPSQILPTILLITGLSSFAATILFGWNFNVGYESVIDQHASTARALIWGIPSALVLLGMLWRFGQPGDKAGREPAITRFLVLQGDASYSLYLVHLCIIVVWDQVAPPLAMPADLFIVTLVSLSVAVSLAAHRWIERPMIGWLRKQLLAPVTIKEPALILA